MVVRYTNFSLFFDLECGFLFKQYDENLKPDKVTVCPKTKKPIRKLIGFKRLWAMRDSNPRPSRCKRDALNQLS